ncbi:response regulator transcription factor [Pseudodesulfovibrio sp.]|uniref:response regulator transcription factor n=1 Tax=unclassified Pseudodesulfovibrio TaxID=2661612 RepID=UPI003AFFEE0E
MQKPTRILIIDDDVDLSALLTEYLEAEDFETHTVHNGIEGTDEALSGAYDAILLDIMLPGRGGVEVLQRIRQESRVPVIMLTAKGDHVDRVVGLEMGADDYVPKPCYPRELVARIRAVLRRTSEAPPPQSKDELHMGKLRVQVPQRRVDWDGEPVDLTVSEFNFLEMLLRAGDKVVTKDELSERALGRTREPYDRSVDVHMSHLRQKLDQAAGDAIVIETVRGVGYRVQR